MNSRLVRQPVSSVKEKSDLEKTLNLDLWPPCVHAHTGMYTGVHVGTCIRTHSVQVQKEESTFKFVTVLRSKRRLKGLKCLSQHGPGMDRWLALTTCAAGVWHTVLGVGSSCLILVPKMYM